MLTAKSDLILMDPHTLTWTVQLIERVYPGWWWSISQKHNDVRISLGPTPNCPHPPDAEYAKTAEGDNGFHPVLARLARPAFDTTLTHRLHDRDVINFRQSVLSMANEMRGFERTSQIHLLTVPEHPSYRRQTLRDVETLSVIYDQLLKTIVPLVKASGFKLEEVYIGSCDLSADCSLRGINVDGTVFDHSWDVVEDGTIAEAMECAVDDLLQDLALKKG